ncbi:MAG: hypothetical protein ACRDP5_24125 [Streptosporangiaceae bacterium]
MTIPYSADLYQAVVPGGMVTFRQLFETWYGSGIGQPVTGVTITITQAGAQTPVLGPTSDGFETADGVTYTYQWMPPAATPPGDYLAVLAGTGTSGVVTYTQAVTVAAPPALTPAPGIYATAAQYQAESGDTYTPVRIVQATLRRATEVIDRVMIGARYAVDQNSMPVDPGILDIFMRATCAQAEFQLASSDPAHVKSQYVSTSVGGVSVTRTKGAQDQAFPPLAPAAAQILQTAGGLPGAPLLGW